MKSSDTKDSDNIAVVCFGEVLWDNLPAGRKPGGAPMNVAYHLNKMGLHAKPISKVGADQDGRDLIKIMKSLQIDTRFCAVDGQHKTSTVEVAINATGDAVYDIVFPVAWDFIEYEEDAAASVQSSDAFVFGSLAGRNEVTRNTLYRLLELATYRIFDVNLREPYYEKAHVQNLLAKTDLLKVNYQELEVIAGWYGQAGDESAMINILQKESGIHEIIVTKGKLGAAYYHKDTRYIQPAYQVTVKDTVGSGDSFLAAFLSGRLRNRPVTESLDNAARVAGYITTLNGACPDYEIEDINNFRAAPG